MVDYWSGGVMEWFAFFYRPISGPIYYWRSAGGIFHWAERFLRFLLHLNHEWTRIHTNRRSFRISASHTVAAVIGGLCACISVFACIGGQNVSVRGQTMSSLCMG